MQEVGRRRYLVHTHRACRPARPHGFSLSRATHTRGSHTPRTAPTLLHLLDPKKPEVRFSQRRRVQCPRCNGPGLAAACSGAAVRRFAAGGSCWGLRTSCPSTRTGTQPHNMQPALSTARRGSCSRLAWAQRCCAAWRFAPGPPLAACALWPPGTPSCRQQAFPVWQPPMPHGSLLPFPTCRKNV